MDYDFINSFSEPQRTGNIICDLNPLSKANILFVIAVSTVIINNYFYGFVLAGIYLIIAAMAKHGKRFFSLYIKFTLFFISFLFLMRACFTDGKQLIYKFYGIHITVEGIELGLKSASLVLGICGAIMLFVQITPMHELMYALEKKGMSHTVSYVILSSFQTIKDLGINTKVIMESQKARGIETEGSVFRRVKAFIPVIGPLILNAMTGTEEKIIAMDARAFSAPVKHTHLSELKLISKREKLGVIFLDIIFGLIIIGRILCLLLN